ncbi:MAG: SPOR domain-containing protein [Ekhidna sp.]|nr:SPOR domain-containing protein [Ekhidna sp.]
MSNLSSRDKKIVATITVIIFLLVGGAGAWYWFIYKPEQKAKEKARLERIEKEKAEKKQKEEQAAKQKAAYDSLIQSADAEFNLKSWESARSQYTDALSLLPNEQYPRDQLRLINTQLEEIAALEAKKADGIVETVSCTSGRFFIIISSSIDRDLAMDYATELAKEGNYIKVIEPNAANPLFHRVSIGDYETREQAKTAAQSNRYFGDGVWVLKY